uniref:Uncharacterized protein n=1 Tax=Solanum tuberosum TaxID=4113 RepID=M1DRA9_SOLTU
MSHLLAKISQDSCHPIALVPLEQLLNGGHSMKAPCQHPTLLSNDPGHLPWVLGIPCAMTSEKEAEVTLELESKCDSPAGGSGGASGGLRDVLVLTGLMDHAFGWGNRLRLALPRVHGCLFWCHGTCGRLLVLEEHKRTQEIFLEQHSDLDKKNKKILGSSYFCDPQWGPTVPRWSDEPWVPSVGQRVKYKVSDVGTTDVQNGLLMERRTVIHVVVRNLAIL